MPKATSVVDSVTQQSSVQHLYDIGMADDGGGWKWDKQVGNWLARC